MPGLQSLSFDGAIVVFGGGPGSPPSQFLPPPTPPSPEDQPATEAAWGLPELRGLLLESSEIDPATQGVSVDELNQ